jgi:hypothetical protein
MPLSQNSEPLCSVHVSGRPAAPFVHTQVDMHAQVGVAWHSFGMGAQYSPPPPATPPTSVTQTVPAGQPVLGQTLLNAPPSGAPASV